MRIRATLFVVLLGWSFLFWQFLPSEWPIALFPALAASVGGLTYGLLYRVDRVTALLGKITIFIPLLQLFTIYIQTMSFSLSSSELWLLYAIVSGLVLERVSPHQQFYTWMFLGIAGKVQFGLVSATLVQFSDTVGLLPNLTWWGSVVLLFLLIPFAVLCLQRLYRVVVLLGLILGLALLVDVLFRFSEISVATFVLALAAVIWPQLIDRWVGRKVFLSR